MSPTWWIGKRLIMTNREYPLLGVFRFILLIPYEIPFLKIDQNCPNVKEFSRKISYKNHWVDTVTWLDTKGGPRRVWPTGTCSMTWRVRVKEIRKFSVFIYWSLRETLGSRTLEHSSLILGTTVYAPTWMHRNHVVATSHLLVRWPLRNPYRVNLKMGDGRIGNWELEWERSRRYLTEKDPSDEVLQGRVEREEFRQGLEGDRVSHHRRPPPV